jgi:hypothetical protein
MKKSLILISLSVLFLFPLLAQSQHDKVFEQFFDRMGSRVLDIVQLEMTPDPVREGQPIVFRATISNLTRFPGKVSLLIKDRDEVVTEVRDIVLQPGENRVTFPQSRYRFSRHDPCFTVEADIARSRKPVDLAKEFCAKGTPWGWTLGEIRIGPFFVEDLDMFPDPVKPGQEIRFKVRIRNDGFPTKVNIRIQDRDQIVAHLNDVIVPRGHSEIQFGNVGYRFQRHDHCFNVMVDVDRTPYPVNAVREFCAKPLGWSLKP